MKNQRKLENVQDALFNAEMEIKKAIFGGFCCTIAGGKNTLLHDGTTVWDCPPENSLTARV